MAKHTLKSCGVNTARFLKYVWPFYNIMNERVKGVKETFFVKNVIKGISKSEYRVLTEMFVISTTLGIFSGH